MASTSDVILYTLAAFVRPRGISVRHSSTQPPKLLKLYDFEASDYCRLVREVLTELDLDVLILPCPKNGTRFRADAQRDGGKLQFPLLVDDNTGDKLYESADIIDYLRRHYAGLGPQPRGWRRLVAVSTSILSSLAMIRSRGLVGYSARASRNPAQPLVLFSSEISPYSKSVRVELCELELPYILRNCGKGHWKDLGPPGIRDKVWKAPKGTSRNRRWLESRTGRVQIPYLSDPNSGAEMFESDNIVKYLRSKYAL